jgi:hypothetical protein
MSLDGSVTIRTYDVAGTMVAEAKLPFVASGVQNIPLTMNAMSAGGYVMVIDAGTHRPVVPFTIVR